MTPHPPGKCVRESWSRQIHGFSLIEIVVVVLVIGILAVALSGQYHKASENTKKEHAESLLKSIAYNNRLRKGAGRGYVLASAGPIDNNSALVREGYLARLDWNGQPYRYWGAESTASCIVAQAARKKSGPSGTTNPEYNSQALCMSADGETAEFVNTQPDGSAPQGCSLTCGGS
ncbi:MAG: prepilin-type N-terminal cleavage/methylation domain-containing protein [Elusimicrobia bacterium]|nr:prepilin-type N-terminal cleavage/methylation domain-containing protein [Elusimicrobiota bacterium]